MGERRFARVLSVLSGPQGHAANKSEHVLEVFVCLTAGAQISVTPASRQSYAARRSIGGAEAWSGRLILEDNKWALHSDDDDDPLWPVKFGSLRPGEYMTLFPPDQQPLGFRIVNVEYPADVKGFCDVSRYADVMAERSR